MGFSSKANIKSSEAITILPKAELLLESTICFPLLGKYLLMDLFSTDQTEDICN